MVSKLNLSGPGAKRRFWDVRFASRVGQISEPCAHF